MAGRPSITTLLGKSSSRQPRSPWSLDERCGAYGRCFVGRPTEVTVTLQIGHQQNRNKVQRICLAGLTWKSISEFYDAQLIKQFLLKVEGRHLLQPIKSFDFKVERNESRKHSKRIVADFRCLASRRQILLQGMYRCVRIQKYNLPLLICPRQALNLNSKKQSVVCQGQLSRTAKSQAQKTQMRVVVPSSLSPLVLKVQLGCVLCSTYQQREANLKLRIDRFEKIEKRRDDGFGGSEYCSVSLTVPISKQDLYNPIKLCLSYCMSSQPPNPLPPKPNTRHIILIQDRRTEKPVEPMQPQPIQPSEERHAFGLNLITGNQQGAQDQSPKRPELEIPLANSPQQISAVQFEFIMNALLSMRAEVARLDGLLSGFSSRVNRLEQHNSEQQSAPRKKIRRKAQDIIKNFYCEYPDCHRRYGSEVSLNLHIRLKHTHGEAISRTSSMGPSNSQPRRRRNYVEQQERSESGLDSNPENDDSK